MDLGKYDLVLVGKESFCQLFVSKSLGHLKCKTINSTTKEFVTEENWPKLLNELRASGRNYLGFLSFPNWSPSCNAETIAKFGEYLKNEGLVFDKYFSLSTDQASLVDNKLSTYKFLMTRDKLRKYVPHYTTNDSMNDNAGQFPLVVRKFSESGGRGSQLILNKNELDKVRGERGFFTEFIRGFEVTQTILMLDGNTIYFPQTWKGETSHEMLHSDQKPKFAGIFPESPIVRRFVGELSEEFSGNYLIAVQCLMSINETDIQCKIVEIESRVTGSTPIMEEAAGVSIIEILIDWLLKKKSKGYDVKPIRPACQFISYSSLSNNLESPLVLEVKDQQQPDQRIRYRISFSADKKQALVSKARDIGKKIADPQFATRIEHDLEVLKLATLRPKA